MDTDFDRPIALLTSLQVADMVRELVARRGHEPFADVATEITEWLRDRGQAQREHYREEAAKAVYKEFNRILGPDGKVIRDWWPCDGNWRANITSYMLRHHRNDEHLRRNYTVETRQDIEREGGLHWFSGKMSGCEPSERY